MDSERWQNVERLYHAAMERDESQRAAFLAGACGGDKALLREVESLVAYGGRSGKFIEGSALELVAPALAEDESDGIDPAEDEDHISANMIGKRIAQYQIVDQLGRGGMGEVYRAVRADGQYQKQVAIKLVRAGQDSGSVINRFKNERQILASLDHLNISRLLDGGATDEGVPYFVMELVEGQPIDKYCDSHKLGIPARLKLFLQVCSALQYAHQRQIIHRDIKPSNILVTEEGVPKLLDFGIAKILDTTALAGEVGSTLTMFRAFTPEYASPEQIKGGLIGNASDVYSLGVLLYELLTGHRPYRFKTRTPAEIEQAICEAEPLKPSTVVTRAEEQTLADGTSTAITPEEISQARDSDPRQMHSHLLGDLDAIVMMALRKEPHRRYASVADLSKDISKHLDGLPITARPSTIAYRGVKFIRRHRELTLTALVFLLLLGSLSIVLAARLGPWRHLEASKQGPGPQGNVVGRQLTANAAGNPVPSAAISRDGKYLAYSDKAWKMYLLQIDSGELRQLPSSDFEPVDWFPDGNHLLVQGRGRHSGLWKMSVPNGSSRRLLDDPGSFAAVSPDGSHIAYQKDGSSNEIWLMGANGEDPRRIAEFGSVDSIDSLAWSPGGQRLVYTRRRGVFLKPEVVIETCDLQGGQRTLVLSEPRLWGKEGLSSVYWLPDGRILYSVAAAGQSPYSDHDIWAIVADPGNGRVVGLPARLTNGVRGAFSFQASADGKRLTYLSTRTNDAIYLGNLEPGAHKFNPRRLTLEEWNNWPFDWTRDSKAVLFASMRNGGRYAILQQRIDQQTPEILLSSAESYRRPVFSPTGDRLLYTASATADLLDPSKQLMSKPVTGGLSSLLLGRGWTGDYHYHCGYVPSARCILGKDNGRELVFYMLDPIGGKGPEIQRVEVPPHWELSWSLSPDGNKIAIADAGVSAGRVRILTLADRKVVALPLRGWKWREMTDVAWSADGNRLFIMASSEASFVILSVDLRGSLPQVLAEVPAGEALLLTYPVASPDGRYLAYMKRSYENNVMMLENF